MGSNLFAPAALSFARFWQDPRFRQAATALLGPALLLGLLTSCRQPPPRSSAASSDGRPLVLTTFTVLADMARNVAGDRL